MGPRLPSWLVRCRRSFPSVIVDGRQPLDRGLRHRHPRNSSALERARDARAGFRDAIEHLGPGGARCVRDSAWRGLRLRLESRFRDPDYATEIRVSLQSLGILPSESMIQSALRISMIRERMKMHNFAMVYGMGSRAIVPGDLVDSFIPPPAPTRPLRGRYVDMVSVDYAALEERLVQRINFANVANFLFNDMRMSGVHVDRDEVRLIQARAKARELISPPPCKKQPDPELESKEPWRAMTSGPKKRKGLYRAWWQYLNDD